MDSPGFSLHCEVEYDLAKVDRRPPTFFKGNPVTRAGMMEMDQGVIKNNFQQNRPLQIDLVGLEKSRRIHSRPAG
jgi:hypothetical protein